MTFDFSRYLLSKSNQNDFTDNDACRMAAYFVQDGRCYVTGEVLRIGMRELHHRLPRYYGGTDVPQNLVLLNKTVHQMVHAYSQFEFMTLLESFPLTDFQLKMVNQLRFEAYRQPIAC